MELVLRHSHGYLINWSWAQHRLVLLKLIHAQLRLGKQRLFGETVSNIIFMNRLVLYPKNSLLVLQNDGGSVRVVRLFTVVVPPVGVVGLSWGSTVQLITVLLLVWVSDGQWSGEVLSHVYFVEASLILRRGLPLFFLNFQSWFNLYRHAAELLTVSWGALHALNIIGLGRIFSVDPSDPIFIDAHGLIIVLSLVTWSDNRALIGKRAYRLLVNGISICGSHIVHFNDMDIYGLILLLLPLLLLSAFPRLNNWLLLIFTAYYGIIDIPLRLNAIDWRIGFLLLHFFYFDSQVRFDGRMVLLVHRRVFWVLIFGARVLIRLYPEQSLRVITIGDSQGLFFHTGLGDEVGVSFVVVGRGVSPFDQVHVVELKRLHLLNIFLFKL